jgi:thiamine-phosphate pyrophosphorylase
MATLVERLQLVLVTNGEPGADTVAVAEEAMRGGVRVVQVREKSMGAGELLALASRLREATRRHGAWLIINDRIDVALACGADGVHLGWRSMPVDATRAIMKNHCVVPDGPSAASGDGVLSRAMVGVSTHSLDEAIRAERAGADYVTFGPILDTPSKRGLVAAQGFERLADCARAVRIPVVAIGGLLPEHAARARRAGAVGLAAIRGLMAAPSPRLAAAAYLERWDKA